MKFSKLIIGVFTLTLLFLSCKTSSPYKNSEMPDSVKQFSKKIKDGKVPGKSLEKDTLKKSKTTTTSSSSSNTKKASSDRLDNALLWKIRGNGLTSTSFLYGTIHIINADDFFFPDGTLEAIDASDKMVFEVDMNEMNDMGTQMEMMKGAFMKDGLSLKDVMSAEDYKLVQAHFKKMGLPMMMFEKMKPMFLTVFASDDINPNDLQSGKIKSYEMEFLEIGKSDKKEMGGLETLEFQMSIFDNIPYEDQADMLIESIKSGDTGGDQFKEMVDMYKRQDISAMVEMFEQEEGGLEGHDDVLVVQRNKNWIPIMEEMMKEKVTFFAVGAGHLAGEKGVIQLLRDQGYTVQPY